MDASFPDVARLPVAVSDRLIPGAGAVSAHSRWEAVAAARPLGPAEVRVLGTPDPEDADIGGPGGGRRDCQAFLDGEWRRRALPEGSTEEPVAPDLDDRDWDRVMVPDGFGAEPSLSAQHGPVWYRKRLARPEWSEAGDHLGLGFDRVDYLCDVWLDGVHLGHHEGFFAPFYFDVTGLVRAGSVLVVRVEDPFEDLPDDGSIFSHAKRRAIKGTLNYHDSRPGGLPGRTFSAGWTGRLAQSLTTGGLTGSVHLDGCGPLRCDGVFVTPLDPFSGTVHAAVVLSNLTAATVDAEVFLGLEAPGVGTDDVSAASVLRVSVPPGPSRIDVEIVVPDPEPWWPVSHLDLGGPVLYGLDVDVVVDGRVSDFEDVLFGLRTARVAGDAPHQALEVNSRPVFVQAANYIPRQHTAGIDAEPYRTDFQLAAAGHLNSVGVHAHLQPPVCYDAADEEGILVFQDFPLQWRYDSGTATNPGFVEIACHQIAEMAYTYWNHPSIVYWACHNEPTAMFFPGKPADPARDIDNQVLDEALEAALDAIEDGMWRDPDISAARIPGAGSAGAGSTGGPANTARRHVHRASGVGDDIHLYDGSLAGGDVYGVADKSSWFVSEFGFWTVGERADHWGDQGWPPDPLAMQEWASRLSFSGATYAYAGLPERYPSLDAWQFATGAYGGFLAKYQTEWIRSHRGAPFMAWRWHFFCDWWGWAGGGLFDVDREPKATFHALAAAARPTIAVADIGRTIAAPGTKLSIPVTVVHEQRFRFDARVRWRIVEDAGSLVVAPDLAALDLYAAAPPTPGVVVAMPLPGLHVDGGAAGTDDLEDADVDEDDRDEVVLAEGLLSGTVEGESTATIGMIRFTLPAGPFASTTLRLTWQVPGEASEHNVFHVLTAPQGWDPGPGAFLVTPTGITRLGLDPDTEEAPHGTS